MKMEDKVLAALHAAVSDAGAEYVTKSGSWANQMTVFAQQGLDTLLAVELDFQSRYLGACLTGPGVGALGLSDSPPVYRAKTPDEIAFHHLDYTDGPRLRVLMELVGRAAGQPVAA
jgi:hypothetical protein